jgi:hypothetical protein
MQLRERSSAAPLTDAGTLRVDRARGVVRDVKVIGLTSKNGRRYLPSALRTAVPLIEGKPVYIDHPAGASNARSLSERFGKLVGVHQKTDGSLWAKELRYDPAHPFAGSFLWQLENDPKRVGLSINGDGSGFRANGEVVIDRITEIHSVDLVDGPATTIGLFEQAGFRVVYERPAPTPAPDPVKRAAALAKFDGHVRAAESARLREDPTYRRKVAASFWG